MKRLLKTLFAAAMFIALATSATAQTPAFYRPVDWFVSVTVDGGPPTFVNFMTFSPDGRITNTSETHLESEGRGVWQTLPNGDVALTFFHIERNDKGGKGRGGGQRGTSRRGSGS